MPRSAKCQGAQLLKGAASNERTPLFSSCAPQQLRSSAVALLGSCAVRHFAPFGSSRPLAVRALRQFAPFGSSRPLLFSEISILPQLLSDNDQTRSQLADL